MGSVVAWRFLSIQKYHWILLKSLHWIIEHHGTDVLERPCLNLREWGGSRQVWYQFANSRVIGTLVSLLCERSGAVRDRDERHHYHSGNNGKKLKTQISYALGTASLENSQFLFVSHLRGSQLAHNSHGWAMYRSLVKKLGLGYGERHTSLQGTGHSCPQVVLVILRHSLHLLLSINADILRNSVLYIITHFTVFVSLQHRCMWLGMNVNAQSVSPLHDKKSRASQVD